MSLVSVYFRLPVFIQELAISAYGYRLKRIRYGGIHANTLRELMATAGSNAKDLDTIQDERLSQMLSHAVANVPYYRRLSLPVPQHGATALDVLRSWPLLNKSSVQASGLDMIAEGGWSGKRVDIHTGGTTGRALAVYANDEALQRNYAFFERQKRWAAIETGDRVATFAGRTIVDPKVKGPPFWRRNYAANQLLLSSYHLSSGTVDDYIGALVKFRPALIDSYPSSLEPIARRVLDLGYDAIRPRAIITSSETLLPSVRRLFERAFMCPVFDHYGSAEMVALVTQCDQGGYHENPEFGILELLDSGGNPVPPGVDGEVVATGFVNKVMPLIRYRLGDIARWGTERCPCGSSFRRIESITGRKDDVIVAPDGRRIGRLDPIFKAVRSLHEARVVQSRLDHLRLEVVVAPDFSSGDEEALLTELTRRVGPSMSIEVVRVSAIPRTRGGKLRAVVAFKGDDGDNSHSSELIK
jgi:phenylacetate-CoA ligase